MNNPMVASSPSLLACVVTYRPDAAVQQRIEAIARQVDHVIIVDNTPDYSTEAIGSGPFGLDAARVSVVFNRNRGAIAGALNSALGFARDGGFSHLVLFDQDTEIPDGLCDALRACAAASPSAGIIGPRYLNSSTGHPGRIVSMRGFFRQNAWPTESASPLEALFLINTCSVLSLDRIPSHLWYDESLIMDNVDVDFCLALRQAGGSIVCFPAVTVMHGIGARKPGSSKFSATNYPPQRKYLQSRNRVAVWRRYVSEHPGFVLQDVLVWLLDSARTLVLEQGRWEKTGAIVRGFFAGWMGSRDRLASRQDSRTRS